MDAEQLGREMVTSISTVRSLLTSSPALETKLQKFDALLQSQGWAQLHSSKTSACDPKQCLFDGVAELNFLEDYFKAQSLRARSLMLVQQDIEQGEPQFHETDAVNAPSLQPSESANLEPNVVPQENLGTSVPSRRTTPEIENQVGISEVPHSPQQGNTSASPDNMHNDQNHPLDVTEGISQVLNLSQSPQEPEENTGRRNSPSPQTQENTNESIPETSSTSTQDSNSKGTRRVLRSRHNKATAIGGDEHNSALSQVRESKKRKQPAPSHERKRQKNKWCICDDPSPLDMIGCDNLKCPVEWYHMKCIGIKKEPTGKKKWFCSLCRNKSSRKK